MKECECHYLVTFPLGRLPDDIPHLLDPGSAAAASLAYDDALDCSRKAPGHEWGQPQRDLDTTTAAHDELVRYLADNRRLYWTDTFLNIMTYVKKQRGDH